MVRFMNDGSHNTIRRKLGIHFELPTHQDMNVIDRFRCHSTIDGQTLEILRLIFALYGEKQHDKVHLGTEGTCIDGGKSSIDH